MGAAGCLCRINRLLEVVRKAGEGVRLVALGVEANQNRNKICRSTDDIGVWSQGLGIPTVWSGVTNELLGSFTQAWRVDDWTIRRFLEIYDNEDWLALRCKMLL
jgi:hypothetical protein